MKDSRDSCLALDHRAAVTPKTKVLILNTPHNPVGKVFTREELEQFAAIAKEHNILILADEVVRPSFQCCSRTPSWS